MKKCIYTYNVLNNNTPEDDNSTSLEHIIPYSLGGSNEFSTKQCSKKANNDLGSSVDAPLISNPLIGFKRHELGLKSYSGDIPDIKLRARLIDSEAEGYFIFPYNKTPYFEPDFIGTGSIQERNISFSGSYERVKNATKGLIEKANSRGISLSRGGVSKITSVTDALANAINFTENELKAELIFDRTAWIRGIIKICLGLGHFVFGDMWTFSPSADKIRSGIVLPKDDLYHLAIRGNAFWRIPDNLAEIMNINSNVHALAVLPLDGRAYAIVSLFGGGCFDAIIDLGEDIFIPSSEKNLTESTRKLFFLIDPTTRQTTSYTLLEICQTPRAAAALLSLDVCS